MGYLKLTRALYTIRTEIGNCLSVAQSVKFDHQFLPAYARLLEDPNGNDWSNNDFFSSPPARHALDAVCVWFLLSLLHDPDFGALSRLPEAQDQAPLRRASLLLRRWLEGDPPDDAEWSALLADPAEESRPNEDVKGALIAASIARLYLFTDVEVPELLSTLSQVQSNSELPANLRKPFPLDTVETVLLPLTLLGDVIVRLFGPARLKTNVRYNYVLIRVLVGLMDLRWLPQHPDEGRLFARLIQGDERALPEYLQCLKKVYVEPNEIAKMHPPLKRLAAVRRASGVNFPDSRFVPGMIPQRLYDPTSSMPGPVVALREYHSMNNYQCIPVCVVNTEFLVGAEKQELTKEAAWKKFEEAAERSSRQMVETEWSESLRILHAPGQANDAYWMINLRSVSRSRPVPAATQPASDSKSAPAAASPPQLDWSYHVEIRCGANPVLDLWNAGASLRRSYRRFRTRGAAFDWYRREIQNKLSSGYAELLPRLTYFSMQRPERPVSDEGEVVFDTEHLAETPEANWLQSHARPAFVPVVRTGESPTASSIFAGSPWLPAGASPPVCSVCQQALGMVVQLRLDQLPPEFGPSRANALLQVFVCRNDACSGPRGPFTGTQLGRVVDVSQPEDPMSSNAAPRSGRQIVGWSAVTDYPTESEYWDLGFSELNLETISNERREEHLSRAFPTTCGTKLGGWPRWSEYPQNHECPECSTTLRVLLQLESGVDSDFSVFEGTLGFVMTCPNHPEVIAFDTQGG